MLTPTQLQSLWHNLTNAQRMFYEEASVAEEKAASIANARDLRRKARDRWPSDTYVLVYAERNGISTTAGISAIRRTARTEFHSLSDRLRLSYYRLWREKALSVVCHNASVSHYATASVS